MTSDDTPTLAVPPGTVVFVDEASEFLDTRNDALKEALRDIDGVPNATYQVRAGRVFVFEKLLREVDAQRLRHSDTPLAPLALSLVAEACVSAQDAVQQWAIVPEPFERVTAPGGGWMIRLRAFNAHLLPIVRTEPEVQTLFARLLLGAPLAGNGEFSYRGQPMSLAAPLDPNELPPRPVIQPGLPPGPFAYTALGHLAYAPGFAPVSEALFTHVQAIERTWAQDRGRIAHHVRARAPELWARIAGLNLEPLNDAGAAADGTAEQLAALRACYPELSRLSEAALYEHFDTYQRECSYISGWEPNRDPGFLFYLLGKRAAPTLTGETVPDCGDWVAYALLRGDSLERALTFARGAARYDAALRDLAVRIAAAMRFLVWDKTLTEPQGPPVTTLSDMMRRSRKVGATAPIFTQQRGDFEGGRA